MACDRISSRLTDRYGQWVQWYRVVLDDEEFDADVDECDADVDE